MKKAILPIRIIISLLIMLCIFFSTKLYSQVVTLTTSATAAGNISQGISHSIVYIVKMDVASSPVLVNNVQFTLTGTFDNNDLTNTVVWFNPSSASLAGATPLVNVSALFSAPHAFNVSVNQSITAGASGYFIITVSTDAAATSGNTIKLNGAANPVTFGFTTSPSITNNQTDIAGLQTIQAAGVTLTTQAIAAANIAQGISHNVVYIVKMDVTSSPVLVNNVQFTLTGTFDNNDLTNTVVWFNPTSASLAGATPLVNVSALYSAPHAFNVSVNQSITAGASGYFIITVSTDAAATSGNTIKLNGASNPVTFGFTTSPSITNNQTDIAGLQTIQAAAVTLTTQAIAAANIAQGTSNSIVYIVKTDVTSLPVLVTSVQFTLTGTFDNNDLTNTVVWFNPTSASLVGATPLVNVSALYAAPHAFNVSVNQSITAGASGYFIITVSTDAAATSGNTIKLNGASNPVTFGFTTSPSITNNQTDIAGLQTIQAAGVTLTTQAIAAANIAQGASNSIVYIVKTDVTSSPVLVNSVQFTLTGTFDNNDLTNTVVWFNPSSASLAGATPLVNVSALYSAPHAFNVSVNQSITAGASGYFIITVSTDAAATSGNTIKLNGAVNPVTFGFATSPPVTNNQTDIAGLQTITSVLPLRLISFTGNAINTQQVKLQWITAGELNTKDFEVEWSDNGLDFSKATTIAASGNSSQNKQYSYIHSLPAEGNNYYRLKIVDQDGRFTYSPVVEINIAFTTVKVAVFPNPVADVLTLSIQGINNATMVCNLFNAEGKLVTTKSFAIKKGINRFSWNLAQIAKGNYFITSNSSHFETIKICKD